MIAISPLSCSNGDGGYPTEEPPVEFSDGFSGANLLLGDIDFDDLFVGFGVDGDLLPDLELDPAEILAEFSIGEEEERRTTTRTTSVPPAMEVLDHQEMKVLLDETETREDERSSEVMSVPMERDELTAAPSGSSSSSESTDRGRKSSATGGSHGKRKVKVDWTPELHRRFVQAVEQLGVDKAVPSRILELMGIDCLTRHNIASHLQKYRSNRKHLLAREAEAASWSQRRQMYAGHGTNQSVKREINHHPWVAPTMGFPPATVPAFRPPLHVWGHPSTVDQSLVPVWPKHLVRPPPPQWVAPPFPPPPTADLSYWHHHHYPMVPTPAMTHFFPQPMPAARFPAPPVQVVAPHPMYRPRGGTPPPTKHFRSQHQLDAHPAKENIDAAIGDALSKPWLPLPLGLKPPSVESVMGELQRQGVSAISPSCS